MPFKLFFLSIAGLLCGFSPSAEGDDLHEFHLSKCQIEYNKAESALQMTLHLFLDDLEEALRKNGADQLHLCSDKETEDAEKFLDQYLRENFSLVVNQQSVTYDFIGKEQSEDLLGVWIYLEVTGVEVLTEISITNRLLTELFDDQKNITSISIPPRKQSYFILDKQHTQETLSL